MKIVSSKALRIIYSLAGLLSSKTETFAGMSNFFDSSVHFEGLKESAFPLENCK